MATGTVSVGRSTFALPPGQWQVVSTRDGRTTVDGLQNGGVPIGTVYVMQQDSAGVYIASIYFTAPLQTARVSGWNDTLCDRKDTLFRDTFSGSFSFPECLLVNHGVRFWVDTPTNDYDRKTWDWYRKNKVTLPNSTLRASYRKYQGGDYVSVTFDVNPEYFGQAPALGTVWASSEWHPLVVKSDPARQAFVDSFKKLAYVMAASAKSTLTDRKPKSGSLPSLDDLRGTSVQATQTTAPGATGSKSVEIRLAELKGLFDKGMITQTEYEQKRKVIIDGL